MSPKDGDMKSGFAIPKIIVANFYSLRKVLDVLGIIIK